MHSKEISDDDDSPHADDTLASSTASYSFRASCPIGYHHVPSKVEWYHLSIFCVQTIQTIHTYRPGSRGEAIDHTYMYLYICNIYVCIYILYTFVHRRRHLIPGPNLILGRALPDSRTQPYSRAGQSLVIYIYTYICIATIIIAHIYINIYLYIYRYIYAIYTHAIYILVWHDAGCMMPAALLPCCPMTCCTMHD